MDARVVRICLSSGVPSDTPSRLIGESCCCRTLKLPKDYVDRVKATHENGWETGSTG